MTKPQSKPLSPQVKKAIAAAFDTHVSLKSIADLFGVCIATVSTTARLAGCRSRHGGRTRDRKFIRRRNRLRQQQQKAALAACAGLTFQRAVYEAEGK